MFKLGDSVRINAKTAVDSELDLDDQADIKRNLGRFGKIIGSSHSFWQVSFPGESKPYILLRDVEMILAKKKPLTYGQALKILANK